MTVVIAPAIRSARAVFEKWQTGTVDRYLFAFSDDVLHADWQSSGICIGTRVETAKSRKMQENLNRISPALAEVLEKGMAFQPEDRYSDFTVFACLERGSADGKKRANED